MNEQFDNELKDHIREVFDNYEDPSANEGWLLLRKKFPVEEKNRGAFLWMWWGAAALLLLSLGFGIWKFTSNNPTIGLSVKPIKHENKGSLTLTKPYNGKVDSVIGAKVNSTQHTAVAIVAAVSAKKLNSDTANQGNVRVATSKKVLMTTYTNAAIKRHVPNSDTDKQGTKKVNANPLFTAAKPGTNKVTANPLIAPVKAGTDEVIANPLLATIKPGVDTTKTTISKSSAGNTTNNQIAASSVQKQSPDKPSAQTTPILSMFNEDRKVSINNKPEAFKTHDKRVTLGIYAATYFNYAKGSNNQVNAGAGVTADVKITNNLKLVSGLAIAQNTLSFANGIPASFGQNNFLSAAANPANSDKNYLAASVPILKNYNANLVGLDIPLNLKYEFNPKKGNAYFLAGLSSGTFINEAYTYQYNYPSISSPSLQKTQDETSSKSFNSFYFARTLNLAFGLGLPVGKNQVIVEPFLKYPLQGMGAQQIPFGAGGINLKFNFKARK